MGLARVMRQRALRLAAVTRAPALCDAPGVSRVAAAPGPAGPARWVVPAGALLAAAGAIAAVGDDSLTVTTYSETSTLAGAATVAAAIGLLVSGAGAWSVRRQAPAVLAVLAGVAWTSDDWIGQEQAPAAVRSLAMVASPLLLPLVVHLALVRPRNGKPHRTERALVTAAYAMAAVVSLGQAAFRDPLYDRWCWRNCSDNVLLVRADVDLAQALHLLLLLGATAVGVALVIVCMATLRRANPVARAASADVLVPAALVGAAEAAYATLLWVRPAEDPTEPLYAWVHLLRAGAMLLLSLGVTRGAWRTWHLRRTVHQLSHELTAAPGPGRLREVLARSVGDERLQVAYWLEGPGLHVDADGLPADIGPADGRTVTTLSRLGRPVAVVVHDADLHTAHALLGEVGAAARLAVDNERLHAEVLYRIAAVEASRARVVERSDSTRRRLERDLHDGAQQRLLTVSYALRLALADARAGGDEQLVHLLRQAEAMAARALTELRELAHGIFPAILSDAGLGQALRTFALSAELPVEVSCTIERRLAKAVEAAAYAVVVDTVADAAVRGSAWVTVDIDLVDEQLVVRVQDEGSPAAELVHLQDRVGALGGRVSTTARGFTAELPCE